MRRILATLFCAGNVLAGTAYAELTVPNSELLEKARAMAEAAKAAHVSSPNDAAAQFMATFNGEMGDIIPVDLRVMNTPELTVQITPPLMMLRLALTDALRTLTPLPSLADLSIIKTVMVGVSPKQRGAPDISRIIAFRGDKEIEPLSSTLKPNVFKNGFGAEFTIHAGAVEFPSTILQPGPDLKLILMAGSTPIEWKLSAADIAKVR